MAILITFNIQNRLVNHSTETAVIKVVNDIRLNTDTGKTSVLVLLDPSAAFDIVDHNVYYTDWNIGLDFQVQL